MAIDLGLSSELGTQRDAFGTWRSVIGKETVRGGGVGLTSRARHRGGAPMLRGPTVLISGWCGHRARARARL